MMSNDYLFSLISRLRQISNSSWLSDDDSTVISNAANEIERLQDQVARLKRSRDLLSRLVEFE